MKYLLLLCCCLSFPGMLSAQWNYPTYQALQQQIKSIGSLKQSTVTNIGKSYAHEDIPIIKIQQGTAIKPTLLIIAGVDGKHPAGIINALNVSQQLLSLPADELNVLLDKKSIWIVPLLNPDAYKRNSNALHWSSGNARNIDNDRDGRLDEDPPQDLNNDGVIAQMRVKMPVGPYKPHVLNADYMQRVETNKGDKGNYELYAEGLNADMDEWFGEDGEGGVNIDRNFTFDYPFFEQESGDYAASEPETKAIVDLIFNHPQIATVLHFGLQNNLSIAEQFDQRKASERIVQSWTNQDVQVSNLVSQFYNEHMKPLGEASKLNPNKGNLSNTIYYHTGKFSFVTPTWWVPAVKDSSAQKINLPTSKPEEKFMLWVKDQSIQGAILPWTKVNHPAFPNQEVEVGGVVERFIHNPPLNFLEESATLHTRFIVRLLKAMAVLEFTEPKIEALGEDIYRIEINVYNTGEMPTYPEIADRLKQVSKMKSILDLQKSQQFLSGKRLQLHPSLKAGESKSFSWLVKGKGKVQLTVGCPSAGEKTISINL
ncbi:M14 family zinc carboxypeptidase [Sphingobacterium sp. HJSM2_6]|uniref:M14 family zinc carboxypeptidase n=1 Tax=Sphingobacterium sp. HJSM2_6 TaxID=3366264 RepID=UPI003BEE12CE